MKAARNKTIDLSVEEGKEYLDRTLAPHKAMCLSEIIDKTICGDFFEAVRELPPKCIDLLIADPPYNLEKDFHGNRFHASSDIDYAEYTRSWISLLMPHLKDTASVYICGDAFSSAVMLPVLKEFFTVRNRITWQREKGRGAKKNFKNVLEDIWFATVSDDYTFHVDAVKMRRRVLAPYRSANGDAKDWTETENGKFRDTYPSNFWDDISIPYWSMKENTAHPTQKPEKLLAKLILASSDVGDLVFDPFLGSGTTSVTAKKLGRKFCGIEQNPRYCVWAEKRLENAETDSRIQGYEDGVFWERNTSNEQKYKKSIMEEDLS